MRLRIKPRSYHRELLSDKHPDDFYALVEGEGSTNDTEDLGQDGPFQTPHADGCAKICCYHWHAVAMVEFEGYGFTTELRLHGS